MPAGAIHDDEGMGAWGDGLAQLVEHELHRLGLDTGQDQGNPGVAFRADGAEQVDGLVAQVPAARWTNSLLKPAPTGAAGLADPGFIKKPHLETLGLRMAGGNLRDQCRELFLKAAWALGSACGCTGLVFCQDRPSPCSRSSMPFSL